MIPIWEKDGVGKSTTCGGLVHLNFSLWLLLSYFVIRLSSHEIEIEPTGTAVRYPIVSCPSINPVVADTFFLVPSSPSSITRAWRREIRGPNGECGQISIIESDESGKHQLWQPYSSPTTVL
ncbi:hypothetical protein MLD38_000361 [Melastoma candidum]|uniref:Uncharacterized protein n=1 Tax=Melastoma candidum TaxID=119954 RepID=A0ACB9SD30_9MYRT|nr:hypothetical protein MLD38_000361 [Melastoma candidum]